MKPTKKQISINKDIRKHLFKDEVTELMPNYCGEWKGCSEVLMELFKEDRVTQFMIYIEDEMWACELHIDTSKEAGFNDSSSIVKSYSKKPTEAICLAVVNYFEGNQNDKEKSS